MTFFNVLARCKDGGVGYFGLTARSGVNKSNYIDMDEQIEVGW
jgi:hypothetical protein